MGWSLLGLIVVSLAFSGSSLSWLYRGAGLTFYGLVIWRLECHTIRQRCAIQWRKTSYLQTHTQTIVSDTGQNPGLDQCCVLTINDKICNNANKLSTNDKKKKLKNFKHNLSFIVKTQVQCLNIYCNSIYKLLSRLS